MIIRSYGQALRIARSAGEDAANRRMRKAGRGRWTAADYDHAVNVMNQILGQLGYGFTPETRLAALSVGL